MQGAGDEGGLRLPGDLLVRGRNNLGTQGPSELSLELSLFPCIHLCQSQWTHRQVCCLQPLQHLLGLLFRRYRLLAELVAVHLKNMTLCRKLLPDVQESDRYVEEYATNKEVTLTSVRAAVKLLPLVVVSVASMLQYSLALKASISASLSLTSRRATDCTLPTAGVWSASVSISNRVGCLQ